MRNRQSDVSPAARRRQSEQARYMHLYGVDIKDLKNYDFVIDTSDISPETVAGRIAEAYLKSGKAAK